MCKWSSYPSVTLVLIRQDPEGVTFLLVVRNFWSFAKILRRYIHS